MNDEQTAAPRERQAIQRAFDEERAEIGASSCTFYVDEKWHPSELRLALMSGVCVPEPMHGLVFPNTSANRLNARDEDEDDEGLTWFSDAQLDARLNDAPEEPLASLAATSDLFAGFARREGVRTCARWRLWDHGRVLAVLWINFQRIVPRTDPIVDRMREFFRRMVETRDQIHASEEPFPARQALEILSVIERLTVPGRSEEWYLTQVLRAILHALDIERDCGSVFLLHPATRTLRRVADSGGVPGLQNPQSIDKGEGVISWVALRQRAILIENISESVFTKVGVYVAVGEPMLSELAVPLMAGDELVGVLNLETREQPFAPAIVRTVWYAANQAVVAYRTLRLGREILVIARDAVVSPRSDFESGDSLAALAQLASNYTGFQYCDLWHRSERGAWSSGSNYQKPSKRTPRHGAWTEWVLSTKSIIWLTIRRPPQEFTPQFRGADDWVDSFPGCTDDTDLVALPTDVRTDGPILGEATELGVPILVRNRAVGVAWLKSRGARSDPPSETIVTLATGFAAQAAMVLDLLQHHRELTEQATVFGRLREMSERLLRSRVLGLPGIDGYAHYAPWGGPVGGDFYVVRRLDEHRTCFVIGDAAGHGPHGAAYMWPMFTTAWNAAEGTESTTHVLAKVGSLCHDWGPDASSDDLSRTGTPGTNDPMFGTALCFIVDTSVVDVKQPGIKRVAASRVGDNCLIIVNRDGSTRFWPDAFSVPFGNSRRLPLTEEPLQLFPGDVLVACTDGVEAGFTGIDKDQGLGRKQLLATLLAVAHQTPEQIARTLCDEARRREAARAEQELQRGIDDRIEIDDMTVLVLRLQEPARPARASRIPGLTTSRTKLGED